MILGAVDPLVTIPAITRSHGRDIVALVLDDHVVPLLLEVTSANDDGTLPRLDITLRGHIRG